MLDGTESGKPTPSHVVSLLIKITGIIRTSPGRKQLDEVTKELKKKQKWAGQMLGMPNSSNSGDERGDQPKWHICTNDVPEANRDYADQWNQIGKQLIRCRNLSELSWTRGRLQHTEVAEQALQTWSTSLMEVRDKQKTAEGHERGKSRRGWLEGALSNGAGKAHKWAKYEG